MKYKIIVVRIFISGIALLPINIFSQELALADSPSNNIENNDKQNFHLENSAGGVNFYKKQKPAPPWFVRRFKATAGMFVAVNGTKIKVGANDDSFGTEIDFEDDLGFKKTTSTFFGNFQWRASRRSRFDLGYFRLDRSTGHILQKDIEFGDHTYPVNASVNSYFKIDMYLFSYGYAFLLKPKYELGLMVGTHVLATDVGISLANETSQQNYKDRFEFTAPLPDIGIWGGYSFANRFVVNGNLNYLSAKSNNNRMEIFSYNLAIMYQLLPDLDASFGYSGMNFTAEVVKNRLDGYVKWGYNGPLLTLSYAIGKKRPFQ